MYEKYDHCSFIPENCIKEEKGEYWHTGCSKIESKFIFIGLGCQSYWVLCKIKLNNKVCNAVLSELSSTMVSKILFFAIIVSYRTWCTFLDITYNKIVIKMLLHTPLTFEFLI